MYGYIYKIENKINHKVYIGQTIHDFKQRYYKGLENTHNRHLKYAIKKYGIENFEITKQLDTAESKEELDEKEIYYIKQYKATDRRYGYDLLSGGHNGTHSEETKKLIGDAQRGNLNHNYGKKGKDSPKYSRTACICAKCGKEIEVIRADMKRSKYHYCSDECRKSSNLHYPQQAKNRIKVFCSCCNKEFERCPSQIKGKKFIYCSKDCQNKHYKTRFNGKDNPNYRNGNRCAC